MSIRPIRFSLTTIATRIDDGNQKVATHGLVSLKYLEAIRDAGLPVRPISMGMRFTLLDEDEEWKQVADLFASDLPLGDDFINLCCGFGAVCFRRTITKGVYNVAITVSWPRPPNPDDVAALNCWDYVVCPNAKDIEVLERVGVIGARQLPIKGEKLVDFFTNEVGRLPKRNQP